MLDQTPPITAFNFRQIDLQGNGWLAFMRAAWSITVSPPGAKPVSDSGKILVVFRKQADGSWLRVADAWNFGRLATEVVLSAGTMVRATFGALAI